MSSEPHSENFQQVRVAREPPVRLGSPSGGRSWRDTGSPRSTGSSLPRSTSSPPPRSIGSPPPRSLPCSLPRAGCPLRHHTQGAQSARRKWRAHPRSCRQTRTAEKCMCKWAREGISRVLDISTPQPWVAPPLFLQLLLCQWNWTAF